jgi:hypothetical protein
MKSGLELLAEAFDARWYFIAGPQENRIRFDTHARPVGRSGRVRSPC